MKINMKINMKRKYQALILVIVAAVFAGLLFYQRKGQSKIERYEAQFTDVFDTVTQIIGYAESEETFTEQISELKEQFDYYNQLYDIYNDYEGVNNIKTINDNAGKEPVTVAPEIIDLLKLGKEAYEKTNGEVNIAYGSVLRLWHDYRESGTQDPENAALPPMEELESRAVHTDIDNLIIDEEASTVYLADPEMSLDVGSIGKGYAVQQVAEYAKEHGMEHLLISGGGNICVVGAREDGEAWRVGIQNPDLSSEEAYVQRVQLQDMSIVTSGNYQRYYEVDGKQYCHIIDKDTMMPAEHMASVSVIMQDSGEADAMSTALFNMEYEEGKSFVESMEGVEAMWILNDGTIKYSSGFSKVSGAVENDIVQEQEMKKNDVIMIAVIVVIALGAFAGINLYGEHNTKDAQAVVTIDGKEYGSYSLAEDTTVKIESENGGFNLLVIEDGAASVEEASCPDKICVRHKPIDKTGETLVCLPNKVVVEIENGEAAEVDASTN